MTNYVTPTSVFLNRVKKFIKKFPTLQSNLLLLEKSLIADPRQGASYGSNIYKVRVADESKGKGKSGGFRIITYLVIETDDTTEILLITILDKSEESTISKGDIKKLISKIMEQRKL